MAFFDQKHELTLWKSAIFWTLKILFFMPKKVSFFPAKSESIISSLILIKSK